MKKSDLIVGKEYKYLHDSPPSIVKYLKTTETGSLIFTEKNGEWIGISEEELTASIGVASESKTTKKEDAPVKSKERRLIDVIYCRK